MGLKFRKFHFFQKNKYIFQIQIQIQIFNFFDFQFYFGFRTPFQKIIS
jgi:hypothetical protein